MPEPKKSNDSLFYSVVVLLVGTVFYLILRGGNLQNTAALYIGLPLILALGLSLTPRSNTVLGQSNKIVTIGLLFAFAVFKEGYICIVFAAPILYIVCGISAVVVEHAKREKNNKTKLHSIAIISLGLLSFEGTTLITTVPRHSEVVVTKTIAANQQAVLKQLSKPFQFANTHPIFLKIFPYPAHITGQGLNVGDVYDAKFVAYKQIWWNRVEGDLIFKVAEKSDNHVKFAIIKDDSYISHYLKWQGSEVFLKPIDANHTQITWKLSYNRGLDPAWYFGPLEHYAVYLSANELIDHIATPHG